MNLPEKIKIPPAHPWKTVRKKCSIITVPNRLPEKDLKISYWENIGGFELMKVKIRIG